MLSHTPSRRCSSSRELVEPFTQARDDFPFELHGVQSHFPCEDRRLWVAFVGASWSLAVARLMQVRERSAADTMGSLADKEQGRARTALHGQPKLDPLVDQILTALESARLSSLR